MLYPLQHLLYFYVQLLNIKRCFVFDAGTRHIGETQINRKEDLKLCTSRSKLVRDVYVCPRGLPRLGFEYRFPLTSNI